MSKFKTGILPNISGSTGGTSFSSTPYGNVMRLKPHPINPISFIRIPQSLNDSLLTTRQAQAIIEQHLTLSINPKTIPQNLEPVTQNPELQPPNLKPETRNLKLQ